MGPRAGLDGRKIPFAPVFDPEPSSPYSVTIPTELPDLHVIYKQIIFALGQALKAQRGVRSIALLFL